MLPTALSGHFPAPRPGPHKSIGYAFLSTPALSPYTRDSPRFKHNGAPALSLGEIGYAVFYPATPPPDKGWFGAGTGARRETVDWLASPKEEVVRGYERFLGDRAYRVLVQAMRLLMTRLRFTASPHASLLPPTQTTRYPLIIFSHGLAGTRTTYAQYCAALASEGYVVLSIEHKDGSGPAVRVPPGVGDELSVGSSGEAGDAKLEGSKDASEAGWLHYTQHKALQYADGEESSLLSFRSLQLELRVREVYETYHSFRRVVTGEVEPTVHPEGPPDQDAAAAFVQSLRDRVDSDRVALTGHSFGGATVLSILQSPTPSPDYSPLPVSHAIALDPWLEPLPTPSPSPSASTPPHIPLLVLNSPGFTIWSNHFDRLVGLVRDARGWLATVMNGNHQSFSDFPLLMPPARKSVAFLANAHSLSMALLRGELAASPLMRGDAEGDMGNEGDGGKVALDEKGKMAYKGDVALHLRGE